MRTLLFAILLCVPGSASFPALGNIDYDFWGYDDNGNLVDPKNGAVHWNLTQPGQSNATDVTFDAPANTQAGPISPVGVPSCSGNLAIAHPKNPKPQSDMHKDSLPTGCRLSYVIGYNYTTNSPYHFAAAYDTLTAFVQHCPTSPDAPSAFSLLSQDVQGGGNGPYPGYWSQYKQWLISALAWNPHDPRYFCSDVQELIGALTTKIDTTWVEQNAGTNASLAVLQWIIQNPICGSLFPDDTALYTGSRGSQYRYWIDTQDTSKVKIDTTLPSMHDLGLDSILKYAGLLGVHEANMASIISNATASPNPTGEGTVISFGTNREAYVRVELFNLLGVKVGDAGFENVLAAGNHAVPISLHGLPSGTYYARILTTYGEVATVKLVKE